MHKAKILIVEDEFVVAAGLQAGLEAMGYEVVGLAASGEDALEQARAARPDLALMDIKLRGEMDGVDAALALRRELELPAIFLTAFADDSFLERARQALPMGYLLKPYQERELRSTIEMALYKRELEHRLRQSEERFRTVADFAYDLEIWRGPEGNFLYVSPSALRITGYGAEELMADPALALAMVHPEDRGRLGARFFERPDQGDGAHEHEYRLLRRDGQELWVHHVSQPVVDGRGVFQGRRISVRDISRRKAMEQERDRLIEELRHALAQVKALSGLLPICASCKKIRDDQGYWQHLECYIQEHSQAEFTHGICPECMERLYPGLIKPKD
jgi:PAS domain S-box-containing protein